MSGHARPRSGAALPARRLSALAAMALTACAGVAFGQAMSTGTDHAALTLSIGAEVAQQVSLSLPVSTLTFDLVGGGAAADGADCVIGATVTDTAVVGPALGPTTLAPAGVTFALDGAAVTFTGGDRAAAGTTPGDQREVCFKDFTLTAFSNVPGWQLSVDRLPGPGGRGIERLYVGAACPPVGGGGFYLLREGDSAPLVLAPSRDACRDVRVVVGVRPAGEGGGMSTASLRYTLLAPGDAFGVAPR
ncbi:MAG: hypothetical protein M9914_14015 [Trueperaceae bacterium]|nr:hypothetical protein [Trueperaceae bacterium]MCO5175290.1 hypothetical protein [Trueperaceae bacterium]